MSTSPVNGYFKQLQDYYVTKADRATHSARTDSATNISNAEFPTDAVTLSSDSIELPRPVRPPNCYSYLDTLTTSDKAVVKAAGWDIDADPLGENVPPEIKDFVGRLNLDRASGALKGDINQSYINKLIQESLSPQQNGATVPLSVLYKVQDYLSQANGKHWPWSPPTCTISPLQCWQSEKGYPARCKVSAEAGHPLHKSNRPSVRTAENN